MFERSLPISFPPLPRLLQLKLRGQTSTSTTPPKRGTGCKKHILHLSSTTPLPHLLQLQLLGSTSTSTTPPKRGTVYKKYILYLTSTTPLPHSLQ